MDSVFMNHYEKQLYSVFKTFDVDNEEALDRQAVLELCDALQLEDRGAALVDTLFESRPGRVTFAQFRNGLLSVLGGEVPSQPSSAAQAVITSPAPGSVQAAGATTPLQSDDDSSGREAVPKFTFGSKKYGRRSRPPRVDSDLSPRHRVASESRLDGERVKLRTKCKRSSSAMETRGDSTFDDDTLNLDHEQRVNSDRALKLCQGLQMHGVDERFIERIFEESKVDEMSVGEFFVRLNSSLQCSIEASIDGSVSEDINAADVDIVPSDVVVEAWERVGVQKARRLLHELGITVAALRLRDLERTLDEEIQALGSSPGISEARSLLLLAASTLSRLRIEQFQRKLDMVVAERDKLRSDLSEANRRARLLAQDVDENHARIEAELKGRLRAVEARHAEAARTAAEEAAAERERAARAQRELEAEVSRRVDAEARLRADLAACVQRNQDLEERNRESESRSAQAERECARLTSEARAAAVREAQRAERERVAGAEAETRVLELRAENQRLRDRADELGAALEARAPAARPAHRAPPAPACWRDETGDRADEPSASLGEGSLASEDERIKTDLDQMLQAILGKWNGVSHEALCERCSGLADALLSALRAGRGGRGGRGAAGDTAAPADPGALGAAGDTAAPADPGALEALRQELAEVKGTHETEKKNLNNVIKELEGSLEQLREEYERCEEYWAGKLQDERDEQRAADERLAELARKVAAYDEQFASALPSVCESALEDQYLQLDAELTTLRRERDEQLGRQAEELAKQKQVIIELEQRVEHQQKQLQHQQQQLQQKQQQRPGARPCSDVDVQRTQARAGAACWCGAAGGGGGAAGAGGAGAAGGSVREAGALRARAARAERAAQRLHARLAAADLLVKDLYIENCRLAHLPHAPR